MAQASSRFKSAPLLLISTWFQKSVKTPEQDSLPFGFDKLDA